VRLCGAHTTTCAVHTSTVASSDLAVPFAICFPQDKAGDGFVTGPEITHGDLNLFVTLSALISGWLDGRAARALQTRANRMASQACMPALVSRTITSDLV
jgi:hypothetical protein